EGGGAVPVNQPSDRFGSNQNEWLSPKSRPGHHPISWWPPGAPGSSDGLPAITTQSRTGLYRKGIFALPGIPGGRNRPKLPGAFPEKVGPTFSVRKRDHFHASSSGP